MMELTTLMQLLPTMGEGARTLAHLFQSLQQQGQKLGTDDLLILHMLHDADERARLLAAVEKQAKALAEISEATATLLRRVPTQKE